MIVHAHVCTSEASPTAATHYAHVKSIYKRGCESRGGCMQQDKMIRCSVFLSCFFAELASPASSQRDDDKVLGDLPHEADAGDHHA